MLLIILVVISPGQVVPPNPGPQKTEVDEADELERVVTTGGAEMVVWFKGTSLLLEDIITGWW